MNKQLSALIVALIAPLSAHAAVLTGTIFQLPGTPRTDLAALAVSIQVRDPSGASQFTVTLSTTGAGSPTLAVTGSSYTLNIPNTVFRTVPDPMNPTRRIIQDGRVSLVFTAGGTARVDSAAGNVDSRVDLILPREPEVAPHEFAPPFVQEPFYFYPPPHKCRRHFFWHRD
jgi:hypothetical protein